MFWDTVLGQRLSEVLINSLPKIAEAQEKQESNEKLLLAILEEQKRTNYLLSELYKKSYR